MSSDNPILAGLEHKVATDLVIAEYLQARDKAIHGRLYLDHTFK